MKAGWQVKALGEVCRLINGRAYKQQELLDEGKYRVLRVGNFFTSDHWYYSDLEMEPDKYCEDGDLLYAWSASFGPRIWRGEKTIYHYHIWKVAADPSQVMQDYLFHFFDWDKEKIKADQGAGTTMIHVSKKSMDAREIPLPPLAEQKQIVAVLDAAFAGLSRARAHVLANLDSARELFDTELERIFMEGQQTWKTYAVGDLGLVQTGSTPKTNDPDNFGDYLPFVKPADFGQDGSLVYSDDGVSEQGAKQCRLVPENSVLMVCIGATIGKAGFSSQPCVTNQQINALSPKTGYDHKFLFYQMRSRGFQEQVQLASGQATLPIINKSKWSALKMFVPPTIAEQKEISNLLGNLFEHFEQLQSHYRDKLADLDALRAALLQKAFAGELT